MRRTALQLLLPAFALAAGCADPVQSPQCHQPAADCPVPVASGVVDPLRHIGRASGPTFIEIVDVVAAGDLVYACTGTKGLTIYDASADDAPPQTRSDRIGPASQGLADARFPRCQHVGLDPVLDRVVITNRGDEIQPTPWLWVYDISDPKTVTSVGGWTPGKSVEGAVMHDGRIYVAMHTSGVTIVDDDGTGTLVGVGSYADDESDAWQPVLVGEHLLVAEGATGLRSYDVAGDEPVLLATLTLSGSSRDLVVRDDIAFVATSGGIASVDISDPSDPKLLGEIEADGTTLAVALGAGHTIVTAEWDEVRGYDFSDPKNPTAVFSELVPSDDTRSRILAVDADPTRNRVYAGEWRGLHAYHQAQDATGPEISVTPGTLQFGHVGDGDSVAKVVVVRNRGDQTLTISDVVGGPGLSADVQCLQIEPGGAAPIEVTFAPLSNAAFDSTLKLCSDDPDEQEHSVDVTANVPGIDVGDPVPMFELTDHNGEVWSPAQLKGNVAVLAYFATF